MPVVNEWKKAVATKAGKQIIGYQGERKTILIVDDKWENRSVLVNLLEPIGFAVVEADNGEDGLAKAAQLQPHLIITDLSMPVMDGFQLLRQIRTSETLKQLLVIVSSASVSEMDRQQSLDAGGDNFLGKPVQAEELFELLEKYLQIKWQYEQTTPTDQLATHTLADAPISNPEIVFPTPEDLAELLSLTRQGRVKKLTEEAKRIQQLDERYAPFIQQILHLAQSFQIHKIENLLEEAINKSIGARN